MAEHGLSVAHTTILRWVQRYTPECDKRWSRFSVQTRASWRVDETYVRIRGQWAYLYRAVDSAGETVDFRLSPSRNVASAKAFFRKATRSHGRSPEVITLNGYAASHRAVRELRQQGSLADLTTLRSSKYQNNLIEQDHCNIKSRLSAMLGLKSFASAATTRGVELMHRIHKGQFAPACSGHSGANSVRNLGNCPGCLIYRGFNLDDLIPHRQFAPEPFDACCRDRKAARIVPIACTRGISARSSPTCHATRCTNTSRWRCHGPAWATLHDNWYYHVRTFAVR